MARTGHADDCPACGYEQLPAEDKASLDPDAFTRHARQEPPQPPAFINDRRIFVLAAGLVAFVALCGLTPVFAVGVLGCVVAMIVLANRVNDRRLQADEEHAQRMVSWRESQTQAWMAARSAGELWACPTCGDRSCSTNHTRTKTVHGPAGVSRSHSDPV